MFCSSRYVNIRTFRKRCLAATAIIACVSTAPHRTLAQGSPPPSSGLPNSIEVRAPDENGVDMYSGSARFSVTDVAIADLRHTATSLNLRDSKHSPLAFNRLTGILDNYRAVYENPQCPQSPCVVAFNVGTGISSERFRLNGNDGSYYPGTAGGMLTSDRTSADPNCQTAAIITCNDQVYIRKDGVAFYITKPASAAGYPVLRKIIHPDGLVENITYAASLRSIPPPSTSSTPTAASPYQLGYPVLSVNRSDGLQLKYLYGNNWDLVGIVALNNAYESCTATLPTCTTTMAWPSSEYSWASQGGSDNVLNIKNAGGASIRYTLDNFGRVRFLKPESSALDIFQFDYCLRSFEYGGASGANGNPNACFYYFSSPQTGSTTVYTEDRIRRVVRDGKEWVYGSPVRGSTIYSNQQSVMFPLIATRPDLGGRTMVNQTVQPSYIVDFEAPGVRATYQQDFYNRPSTVYSWFTGGLAYTYSYDTRGNVLSDGFVTAGYEASCTNTKTCNKPIWTRDAKGQQTDYVYDAQHGGVLTVTSPPNDTGIRPQKRYSYVQRYAWYLNSSGQMIRSTEPIWKLATERFCRTGAAAGGGCALANDEVVTSYDYGPDSGPNNLWLRGVTVTADGVTSRTCYRYNRLGQRISTTTARAGVASCE